MRESLLEKLLAQEAERRQHSLALFAFDASLGSKVRARVRARARARVRVRLRVRVKVRVRVRVRFRVS